MRNHRAYFILLIAFWLALAGCNAPWMAAAGGGQVATQQAAATQLAGMSSMETAVGRAPSADATPTPELSIFLPEAPSGGATPTPEGGLTLHNTPAGETSVPRLSPAATQNSLYFPVAPVLASAGTPTPRPVDPRVVLQLSSSDVQVGELLTVTGQVLDIGLPYYYLYVQDPDVAEGANLAKVTYENRLELGGGSSKHLALIAAKGTMYEVTFTLRGLSAGQVQLWVNASGEIHEGYPGPAYWGWGGSGPVTISVTD